MRVKKKKHGTERLNACADVVIEDLKVCGGNPKYFFGNGNPVMVEIGCGKGDFVVGTAKQNPDCNFLALEKISDVLVTAAEKVKKSGLSNVKVACVDAKDLPECFNEGSIDTVFLNFSDPWPKARHFKRRLTYREFLEMYKRLLKPFGKICFKTDNRELFDFSLEEFEAADLKIQNLTYDLHNSEYNEGNVMREYEKRFSALGTPINRAEAVKKY